MGSRLRKGGAHRCKLRNGMLCNGPYLVKLNSSNTIVLSLLCLWEHLRQSIRGGRLTRRLMFVFAFPVAEILCRPQYVRANITLQNLPHYLSFQEVTNVEEQSVASSASSRPPRRTVRLDGRQVNGVKPGESTFVTQNRTRRHLRLNDGRRRREKRCFQLSSTVDEEFLT